VLEIDFSKKPLLNESILKWWGFWNKKLLRHIYGDDVNVVANLNEEDGEKIHFSIKGEYEDVKAYATALKAESDHLRAYVDHGKNAEETKEAKQTAEEAGKDFTNRTGLPWPFKD
jgi:hypothetical protein